MGFNPELLAEAHRRAATSSSDMAFREIFIVVLREWQAKGLPTLVGDTRPTHIIR